MAPSLTTPLAVAQPQAGTGRIRVLSVPASHVYVWHLAAPYGDDGVTRLADPVVNPDNAMSPWWPPPSLDPAWIRDHAGDFDLVHVHFGFEKAGPDELAHWVETLREAGKPLVYTVHDLRNPHHYDRAHHDAQLDVLIPSADAVITLTEGAADEIERRWGRRPVVLPHPHVVDPPLLHRPRPTREDFVVGVHLKSVRANMAPVPVVDALVAAVDGLCGVRLQVNIHDEVMEPDSELYLPDMAAYLHPLAEAGSIDLRVHRFFTDAELFDYLQSLDLSVLPYRFGTHSGWMEACYDLGTPVLAPDCGYYADQRPCLTYHHDLDGLDAESMRDAVRRAVAERPTWRPDPDDRIAERAWIADEHRRLYTDLLVEGLS